MPKQVVNNAPGAVPALPVYSQAVISNGTVYVSGSIGCDQDYNVVGGILQQSALALENMQKVLEGAGSGARHILKVTAYLSNMTRDYVAFNDVYHEFFGKVAGPLPARTCVGVAALPLGAFVEVECIAELKPNDE